MAETDYKPIHTPVYTEHDVAELRAQLTRAQEACKAALAYDAAIQCYAAKGKRWVGGDDLDALYADWIDKARAAV